LGNDIKAKANKVVENAENDTNEMLREVGDELLQGAKTVLGNTKNTIDSVVSAIDNQLGKAIGADRYIRQRARNAHLKASSNEDNISRSFR
jgi:predicted component of type VI protein secretion system